MLKIILIKSAKYLLILIDIIKVDIVGDNKCRSIKKNGNKTIKILTKLKSWNLPKFRSKNLTRFKKVQKIDIVKKCNLLTSNTRIVFAKV